MRRRLVAGCLALAVALAACGGSSGKDGSAERGTTTTASTTTTTSPERGRPYEVTRRDLTVVDRSRPTAADPGRNLPAKPERTIPVLVLAPDGRGPFPIVEFSHGHTATAQTYEPFLKPIAAAGFMVVAPTFPLSSGPGAPIGDYVNQPGDVYAAIDEVVRLGKDPKDPLHGRVDAGHIALAGHSLGGITTVGAAYDSCCTQRRVDTAIVLSGVELPFPGGDFTHRPAIPLLLGHGDADTRVPISGSENLYAAATGPVAFLRLLGAPHSGIFLGPAGEILQRTIIAWLDRWLYGDKAPLAGVPAAVKAAPGVATFESRGLGS